MKQYIGLATFFGITLTYVFGMNLLVGDIKPPTEGIPHNYWHPDVFEYKSDTIYGDSIIYCNNANKEGHLVYWNGDTLNCTGCSHVFIDTSPEYTNCCCSEGCDNSDEYKMWIGGNGDTIWE